MMETQIAFEKDGKNYNKFHEEIIKCKSCGNPTTMLGTKLCDHCWNARGIFTASEAATIMQSLDTQKKVVLDLRVGRHWTREDKLSCLKSIDTVKQKIRGICDV